MNQYWDQLVQAGAVFSPDRIYRYALFRQWDEDRPRACQVVIGLNPSTADESINDPTIRKCIGRAKRNGFNQLVMLNIFALRSTDPKKLKQVADPIGPENDVWIREICNRVNTVIVAWGNDGEILKRGQAVSTMLFTPGIDMYCLGTNKNGEPKHPLYLSYEVLLVPYTPVAPF